MTEMLVSCVAASGKQASLIGVVEVKLPLFTVLVGYVAPADHMLLCAGRRLRWLGLCVPRQQEVIVSGL